MQHQNPRDGAFQKLRATLTRRSQTPYHRSWISLIVRSLISLTLVAGSIGLVITIGKGSPPPREDRPKVIPFVEVEPVEVHSGGIDLDVDGTVIPFRRVEVPAEVGGRIEFKSDKCRVGHTVGTGDVLVRIDPEEFELEVRRIKENVKQARANLAELEVKITARKRQIELAKEDLTIKRREVARYEGIDDPGVYSQSELDTSRLKELQARDALQTEQDQLDLLEASRNRLEAAIDLGEAELQRAKLDLARTEILSPIDGIITQEGPEQGGFVERGGMIAVVQDTSQMEIRCSLPMEQLNWLWQNRVSETPTSESPNAYQLPQTPATVLFDSGVTTYKWRGQLTRFDGGQVDQQTRMVPCRVVVEKPSDVEIEGLLGSARRSAPITLLAGMFVNTQLHAASRKPLLRLPERAVQPGNHVWIVRREPGRAGSRQGRLRKEQLRIAHITEDTVLAFPEDSGLNEGDLVVVSPLASPTEDGRVEIVE